MSRNNGVPGNLSALGKAYLALPETERQKFIQRLAKDDKQGYAHLLNDAGFKQGSFRPEYIQKHYHEYCDRLDASLLSPRSNKSKLLWHTYFFLRWRRQEWLAELEPKADRFCRAYWDDTIAILAQKHANDECLNDPLWTMFLAMLQDEGWNDFASNLVSCVTSAGMTVNAVDESGENKAKIDEQAGLNVGEACSSEDTGVEGTMAEQQKHNPLEEIRQLSAKAEVMLRHASVAKPFVLEEAHQLFDRLAEIGTQLRAHVEQLVDIAGHPSTDWKTLEELEGLTQDLESLAKKSSEDEIAKALLLQVAEVLRRIVGITIKKRSRRDELLAYKDLACEELAAAASEQPPFRLPGDSADGETWLRAALALEDEALDSFSAELDAQSLGSLSTFISNTKWEELVFQEPGLPPDTTSAPCAVADAHTVSGNKGEPQAQNSSAEARGSQPVVSERGAQGRKASLVRTTLSPAATQESISVPEDEEKVLERTAAPPLVTVALLQPSEPILESPCVQDTQSPQIVVAVAGAETEAEAGRELPAQDIVKEAIEVAHALPVPCSPDQGRINETIDFLAARALWRVAAAYLRAGGSEEFTVAASMLSLVSLHTALCADCHKAVEQACEELKLLFSHTFDDGGDVELLCWAACVVPALVAPHSSAGEVLRQLSFKQVRPTNLASPLKDVVAAVNTLGECVKNLTPALLRGGGSRESWERDLAAIRTRISDLQRKATSQIILYQPATEVWHHMTKKGKLAELTRLVTTGSAKDSDKVQDIIGIYSDPKQFRRQIDETDKLLNHGRLKGIEARAVPQIEGKALDFVACAKEWLRHQQTQPHEDYITKHVGTFRIAMTKLKPDMEQALKQWESQTSDSQPTYLRLAVNCVWDCLQALSWGEESDMQPSSSFDVWQVEPLRVPDLDLDDLEAGGDSQRVWAAVEAFARTPVSPESAVRSRIDRGDLAGARRLLGAILDDESRSQLETELMETAASWEEEIAQRLKRSTTRLATIRAFGLLDGPEATSLEEQLVDCEKQLGAQEERYDRIKRRLDQLDLDLAKLNQRQGEEIKEQLDKLEPVADPGDLALVRKLYDRGDILPAREYLGRLEAGDSLADAGDVIDPWREFFPEVLRVLNTQLEDGGIESVKRALRAERDFAGLPLSRVPGAQRDEAIAMLQAWQELKQRKACDQAQLKALFGALGFQMPRFEPGGDKRFQQMLMRCNTINNRNICPIPRLGSECNGQYLLLNLWDRPPEDAIVQLAGDTAAMQNPVIVVYYGRMTEQRRRDLAKLCRESIRSFLVLDETLLVFLCRERGLRLPSFFRCALPFSYATPYTAAGPVPPEMFYGREREMAELLDMKGGSCFVYGGRQLGKTALLREAERRFHKPGENSYSLWLDLLPQQIGTGKEPSELWRVLYDEFSKLLPQFQAGTAKPDNVATAFCAQVKAWLGRDSTRRILLLLDEADNFLDRDSASDFSEARRLKGLMDETDRQIKIVFAGLHNVQRTTRQRNHPLAHLGEPIAVCSFAGRDWLQGCQLVVQPLAAQGFRFADRNLVMRILALCNFYPGLIQKFCGDLLKHLRNHLGNNLPGDVAERDVEEVYESKDLQQFIVGRFRLTLDLDPRYHLVAYVLALKFHEDAERRSCGYSANELQRDASDFWREGVKNMSAEEFSSLLDEMCGLGILRHCDGSRYSLRNPNLLLLLGDMEKITQELVEIWRPEIVEYMPKTYHLPQKGNPIRRYPLTIAQEGDILNSQLGSSIVVGSPVLALPELRDVLKVRNKSMFNPVLFKDTNLNKLISRVEAQLAGKNSTLFWIDSDAHWELSWLDKVDAAIKAKPKSKASIRAVFSANPERWWSVLSAENTSGANRSGNVVRLRKWQPEFIQPWLSDCGWHMARRSEQMAAVFDVAGGWPAWLYRLVGDFDHSKDHEQALANLSKWLEATENAEAVQQMYGIAGENFAIQRRIIHELHELLGDEPFDRKGLGEVADILGESLQLVSAVVTWGCDIGLFDADGLDAWSWDKVFVKSVTK